MSVRIKSIFSFTTGNKFAADNILNYTFELFARKQNFSICRRQIYGGSCCASSLQKGRKLRGKSRKHWLPAFSTFPTMFHKSLSSGASKVVLVRWRIEVLIVNIAQILIVEYWSKTTPVVAEVEFAGNILFPNKPLFLHVCSKIVLKTLWVNEQFLLSPQCYLPFRRNLHHFHQIQKCRLQTLSV